MFEKMTIDGITLEPIGPQHAEGLYTLVNVNRDHLRQFLDWVDERNSLEDFSQYIESARQMLEERGDTKLVILLDGKPCGMVGLVNVDRYHGSAGLAYWLGKEYEGRGLVARSVRVLLDYAFGELALNRVEVQMAPENLRSKAVPIRLGFTYEGTLRQVFRIHDRVEDSEVYSMLRDEWAAKSQV